MDYIAHSRLSCRKFGGDPNSKEDYLQYMAIHKFLDSSKYFMNSWQHRALLHNNWGAALCVRLFGDSIANPSGKQVLVRDIAFEHIREDCDGKTPTIDEWFAHMIDWPLVRPDFAGFDGDRIKEVIFLRKFMSQHWVHLIYTDFFRYIIATMHETCIEIEETNLVKNLLINLRREEVWMNGPLKREIQWLEKNIQ